MSGTAPSSGEPPIRDRIRALHAWYCDNVMNVPLLPEVERLWLGFFKAGYNGHQLAAVIRYLRREIGRSARNAGSLKLSNLLAISEDGSLLKFAEDLAMSGYRPKKMTALPVSEGGTGKTAGPAPKPAKTIQGTEWGTDEETHKRRLEELQRLKESLS